MGPRRTSRRHGRALALALAVCAHLLAFLALGWRIPTVTERREADLIPPMEIALVRPPKPVPPTEPAPVGAAPVRQPQSAPPAPVRSPSPPVLTQPAPAAPPSAPAASDSEHFRSALRGLVGCSDPEAYHLTREERSGCDQRLAAATPAPVSKTYDAEALAQFDAENRYDPILVRKAHNGCLPRVADRPPEVRNGPPPSTRSGASTAFGFQCARSF